MQAPFLADLPLTCAALDFAVERHAGQQRDADGAPFILHPLEVAVLLRNTGHADEVVAAGLLHDLIEDTDTTPEELLDRFGPRVCNLVAALSEDPSIEGYEERKGALREKVARGGEDVLAIYAADKLSKAREMRARVVREPKAFDDPAVQRRLEHYDASLGLLLDRLAGHALVRALHFELWALRTLPPGAEVRPA